MNLRRTGPRAQLFVAVAAGSLLAGACASDAELERAQPTTSAAPTTTTTAAPTTTTEAPFAPGEAPTPPATAAAAAAEIEATERAIRDPAATAASLAAIGHRHQVAYRAVAANPEWDAEVRARLPELLHGALAANVRAGRELAQLVRRPREELPAWRIIEPDPADALLAHYRAAQEEFGVGWEYLAAIHLVETRMGRIRGTSTAGAQGPMQFLPSTWDAYGEGDINDTGDSIRAAARYLRANGAPDDMDNALYRYNPTERYVEAIKEYAGQMEAEPRLFLGYYHWQVYYTTVLGSVLLPVGYEATETRPVEPADVPVARSTPPD